MTDVVVDDVDFSGADLEDAVMTRVTFANCRFSGVLVPRARLRDVSFVGCRLDGVNLRMVNTERILFENVDLHDADLLSGEFLAARFFDCNLDAAQFSQALLPGARLHGSSVLGIKGAEYLRHVIIDSTQILHLALPVFCRARHPRRRRKGLIISS
jgi:uncharacterized protein YjbI with pentapeptide repeats